MDTPATTATTTPTTTPTTSPATSPATSNHPDEQNDYLYMKLPVLTSDFYLDTLFNPVWMCGPHVFSFAKDGTVVRPETYSLEPYPGYHLDRARRPQSVNASHFQGISTEDSKPWKNVAITEHDDAEFVAIQARVQAERMGEFEYHPSEDAEGWMPCDEKPKPVYTTWPPEVCGRESGTSGDGGSKSPDSIVDCFSRT